MKITANQIQSNLTEGSLREWASGFNSQELRATEAILSSEVKALEGRYGVLHLPIISGEEGSIEKRVNSLVFGTGKLTPLSNSAFSEFEVKGRIKGIVNSLFKIHCENRNSAVVFGLDHEFAGHSVIELGDSLPNQATLVELKRKSFFDDSLFACIIPPNRGASELPGTINIIAKTKTDGAYLILSVVTNEQGKILAVKPSFVFDYDVSKSGSISINADGTKFLTPPYYLKATSS